MYVYSLTHSTKCQDAHRWGLISPSFFEPPRYLDIKVSIFLSEGIQPFSLEVPPRQSHIQHQQNHNIHIPYTQSLNIQNQESLLKLKVITQKVESNNSRNIVVINVLESGCNWRNKLVQPR